MTNFFVGGIFKLIFILIFLVFLGIFFFTVFKVLREKRKNDRSPRLTVPATIVSKRADTTQRSDPVGGDVTGAQGYTTASSTTYYVTFQVESGDRMEFSVPGSEYGFLIEGDRGRLSFQGTRFLSFERG
ncbi:MAG: DUF2500 domain-containing protein [Clostridia bacterium]|nr:DUF2500 domain-containing protein [Clostridia bacterium]